MRKFLKLAFSLVFFIALVSIGFSFWSSGNIRLSSTASIVEISDLTGVFLSKIIAPQITPQLESTAKSVTDRQQLGQNGDKLVIGGTFLLESGETLNGGLIILGGSAELEQGSTVEKDVAVIGGTVNINGQVKGNVSAVGGMVSLGSSAVIEGNVSTVASQLTREAGAKVEGKVNTVTTGPFSLVVPGTLQIPGWENFPPITLPRSAKPPIMNIAFNPIWDGLWLLIRSFLWAAVAVLVALFLSQRTERVAESVMRNPLVAGGMGCLTLLIIPLVLVVLVITICGIPFALLGTFILWTAWGFGMIAIGYEIGKRMAHLFKSDWAIPVSAGVGTFVLTLGLNGIGALVPCVGWMAPAIVGLVGLGAVLLTRFGGRPYPYPEPESNEPAPGPPASNPLPPAQQLGSEASLSPDQPQDGLPLPGEQPDQPDSG